MIQDKDIMGQYPLQASRSYFASLGIFLSVAGLCMNNKLCFTLNNYQLVIVFLCGFGLGGPEGVLALCCKYRFWQAQILAYRRSSTDLC